MAGFRPSADSVARTARILGISRNKSILSAPHLSVVVVTMGGLVYWTDDLRKRAMSNACNEDLNPEVIPTAGTARHIRVPAGGIDDFRALLADPILHWKKGRSAYELAHSWWKADQHRGGFPPAVRDVLNASGVTSLKSLKPVTIFPEVKSVLPGGNRCSQTDLWVLASRPVAPFAHLGDDEDPDWISIDANSTYAFAEPRELVSIAVEGKVREDFGPLMSDWLKNASLGKQSRLRFLCHRLGLTVESLPGSIRYQLLHRTVSALIEAEKFCVKHALMLVHSFDPNDCGFRDYQAFASLLGAEAAANSVVSAGERSGIQLHLAWVRDMPTSA